MAEDNLYLFLPRISHLSCSELLIASDNQLNHPKSHIQIIGLMLHTESSVKCFEAVVENIWFDLFSI